MSSAGKTDSIELRFELSDDAETIQALLASWNPTGFLEDEQSWSCYFNEEDWTHNGNEIETMLTRFFPSSKYTFAMIQSRNWNEEWERSIEPVVISERFMIAPSWKSVVVPKDCFLLIIDPKMSFGTGFHATTRLMLRLMEEVDFKERRVLDVGTGTGVLAIAAVKLGAEAVLGIDIDEWSFDNAVENAVRNNVEEKVRIRQGTVDVVDGTFDIVLANITRNDNINLMSRYSDFLATQGRLLLSGFYASEVNQINQTASEQGFEFIRSVDEDEWAAMMFERI